MVSWFVLSLPPKDDSWKWFMWSWNMTHMISCRNSCILYIHLAFTYSIGPSTVVWIKLGPALPFPPMKVLEVLWSRALSLVCELALTTVQTLFVLVSCFRYPYKRCKGQIWVSRRYPPRIEPNTTCNKSRRRDIMSSQHLPLRYTTSAIKNFYPLKRVHNALIICYQHGSPPTWGNNICPIIMLGKYVLGSRMSSWPWSRWSIPHSHQM
jgi:hypothetical protein